MSDENFTTDYFLDHMFVNRSDRKPPGFPMIDGHAGDIAFICKFRNYLSMIPYRKRVEIVLEFHCVFVCGTNTFFNFCHK